MSKFIVQHFTDEHQALYELSGPSTRSYAERMGFEYVADSEYRCRDRSVWWEKIAYLRSKLPTLEENALVVWLDVDSLILKDESFELALPTGSLGMVENRAGLNGRELTGWYNAGVIVMRNVPLLRDFLDRVWARPKGTDEEAINEELRQFAGNLDEDNWVTSMHFRWNCWANNLHLCHDPVVRSWHGMRLEEKLPSMRSFLGV